MLLVAFSRGGESGGVARRLVEVLTDAGHLVSLMATSEGAKGEATIGHAAFDACILVACEREVDAAIVSLCASLRANGIRVILVATGQTAIPNEMSGLRLVRVEECGDGWAWEVERAVRNSGGSATGEVRSHAVDARGARAATGVGIPVMEGDVRAALGAIGIAVVQRAPTDEAGYDFEGTQLGSGRVLIRMVWSDFHEPVSVTTVRQLIAAAILNDVGAAVLITNSTLTAAALELSRTSQVPVEIVKEMELFARAEAAGWTPSAERT